MNRYYDPESGQYLSQDPIGLEGGLRTHGYVHDPVQWIDPMGLAGCPVKIANASSKMPKRERVNFTRWKAKKVLLKDNDVLYRVHPKGGSGGPWWTRTKPTSEIQHRIDTAWKPEWGTADEVSILQIPKGQGLSGWEGTASNQGGFYVGGGNQIYIPNVPKSWISTGLF